MAGRDARLIFELLDLLSSSSSSSSDEDNFLQEKNPRKIPKIANFLQVVHNLTDKDFKSHFRVTRTTVAGFPNVIGCVDGTSIKVRTPAHKIKSTYVNRHDIPAITLQGICDARKRFIDVFTGIPGKIHDSRVLKLSDINDNLQKICEGKFHILGDAAYPIREWLMIPYRDYGNLSDKQKKFNKKFCATRVLIKLFIFRATNMHRTALRCLAGSARNSHFQCTRTVPSELNEFSVRTQCYPVKNAISVSFRSWDLYEYPMLQSTTKHSWAVKTATQLEKPRYVIFALQTGRKNIISQNVSVFDACNLTNVKLYLNSEFYPYDDMNLDFTKNRYAVFFDMYARFRKTYYGYDSFDTLCSLYTFLMEGLFVVIDCSRQNESVKSATVDVRIEFDFKENVTANTTAYCLILHDRVIEYCPLSNVVRKLM
ncbi:uncharacterized protein LOC143907491 [Temnothorax americanus]|uniref:uncharacterized protein LOC143907491 n=1 Tax=Temnothorax americanus TaxID=1964332 RepID=UPI004067E765